MTRVGRTSRGPWLLLLVLATGFAVVCLWWVEREASQPAATDARSLLVQPVAFPPTPRPQPEIPEPRAEPPARPAPSEATLEIHLVTQEPAAPAGARLVWPVGATRTTTLPLPPTMPACLSLPAGDYLFHVEADDHLGLERYEMRLAAGQVHAATFRLTRAATLEAVVRASIRGGMPPGARLAWQPAASPYFPTLRELQPPAALLLATESVRIGPLYPGAPYELVAGASGCLEQKRTLVAGQVQATTFYLNSGGVIAGFLFDASSGLRVPGRALELWGRAVPPDTAITNASGEFRFDSVWPGEYRFELGDGPGILLESQGTPRPVALRLAERREDVALALGIGGAIRVRLLNPLTGDVWNLSDLAARSVAVRPAEAPDDAIATLRLHGAGIPREVVLSRGGRAEAVFDDLPAGSYAVELGGASLPSAEERLELGEGELRVVQFAVLPGNRIAGRLLSAAGAPVPGATVAFYVENPYGLANLRGWFGNDQAKARVPTSATGFFETPLAPGFYTLTAQPEGHTPGVLRHVPTGREEVEMRLPEGGRLDLIVHLPDGSLASGLAVEAQQEINSNPVALFRETFRLDASGQAMLERLPAGIYTLHNAHGVRWFRHSAEVDDGRTTRVVVGGPGVALEGVVEVDGAPGEGLGVWFASRRLFGTDTIGGQGESPPDFKAAVVGEHGRYRLAGLPPGGEGWITVMSKQGRPKYPYHVPCALPESGTKTLHLRLATGIIRGVVHDWLGMPMADVRVELLPVLAAPRELLLVCAEEILAREETRATTDLGGRFMFTEIPPGSYRVTAREDDQALAAAIVEMPESAREQEVLLEVAATGTLAGRVTGAASRLLKNSVLAVRDEEGVLSFLGMESKPDENPERAFVSRPLPAGKYRVSLVALISSDPVSILCPDREREVEVAVGAETYVEFHVRHRYAVVVRCVDAATGRPVPGAEVSLPGGRRAQAAAIRGYFASWHGFLPSGRHDFRAVAPGYHPTRLTVEVGDNSPTQHVTVKMVRAR